MAALLQAGIYISLARTLGPSEFGLFSLGIAAGIMSGALLGFGSTSRALRILREDRPRHMADNLTLLRTLSTAAVFACSSITVLAFSPSSAQLATCVAIVAAVDHFCEFEQVKRMGELAAHASSRIIILQRALPAVAIGATLVTSIGDPLIAFASSSLVVLCIALIRPIRRGMGIPNLKSALRGSRPYWVTTTAQSLNQLDQYIITAILGSIGAGAYGISSRLVGPVNLLISSATSVLSPYIGQLPDATQRYAETVRFARFACILGVLIAICAWPISGAAAWVLGAEYAEFRTLIAAMLATAGLGSVIQVLMPYLNSEGLAADNARIAFLSAGAGIMATTASAILIGIQGLWFGPAVNYSVLLLLLTVVMRRHRAVIQFG